eukprot:scaffold562_cov235-Prasinococcus_capsulatus_cf.AAC.1
MDQYSGRPIETGRDRPIGLSIDLAPAVTAPHPGAGPWGARRASSSRARRRGGRRQPSAAQLSCLQRSAPGGARGCGPRSCAGGDVVLLLLLVCARGGEGRAGAAAAAAAAAGRSSAGLLRGCCGEKAERVGGGAPSPRWAGGRESARIVRGEAAAAAAPADEARGAGIGSSIADGRRARRTRPSLALAVPHVAGGPRAMMRPPLPAQSEVARLPSPRPPAPVPGRARAST